MSIVRATPEYILQAAKLLREGKLIGIPTETVYGIAANALNEQAVAKIFELKGRPSENPLIVHVHNSTSAITLAREFPAAARKLADLFWPGPLTIVVEKSLLVPSIVTAGLNTVAIRVPDHPVALSLIQQAGVPLSAPSANKFMSLSPTTASMIDPDIASGLEMVLDGGPCEIGIESTVVDLTGSSPVILRRGQISEQQIAEALNTSVGESDEIERRSPGMYPKHYAPRSPVKLVDHLEPGQAGITFDNPNGPNQIPVERNARAFAKSLYHSLFDLDQMRIGTIFVQTPPRTEEWQAVWDRLTKITG
jgi:L-threonylcarbamoyladenylate synthase